MAEKVGHNLLFVGVSLSADDANVLDLAFRVLKRGCSVASLIPYIEHPIRTANLVLLHALSEEELVAVRAANIHSNCYQRELRIRKVGHMVQQPTLTLSIRPCSGHLLGQPVEVVKAPTSWY